MAKISDWMMTELRTIAADISSAQETAKAKAKKLNEERGGDPADTLGYRMAMELGFLQAVTLTTGAKLTAILDTLTEPKRRRPKR